jgi:hypothetical protein
MKLFQIHFRDGTFTYIHATSIVLLHKIVNVSNIKGIKEMITQKAL